MTLTRTSSASSHEAFLIQLHILSEPIVGSAHLSNECLKVASGLQRSEVRCMNRPPCAAPAEFGCLAEISHGIVASAFERIDLGTKFVGCIALDTRGDHLVEHREYRRASNQLFGGGRITQQHPPVGRFE